MWQGLGTHCLLLCPVNASLTPKQATGSKQKTGNLFGPVRWCHMGGMSNQPYSIFSKSNSFLHSHEGEKKNPPPHHVTPSHVTPSDWSKIFFLPCVTCLIQIGFLSYLVSDPLLFFFYFIYVYIYKIIPFANLIYFLKKNILIHPSMKILSFIKWVWTTVWF